MVDQKTAPGRVASKILSDGSLTKKASLNAFAAGIDQAARIALKLVLTPFLVTRLGDAVFGTWQVLRGLIDQTAPASGRPGEALKWTVARDQASTDHDRKRRHVGNALGVWVLFLPLLVVTGATLGWFSPIWLGVPPGSYPTVRLAAAILVADLVLAGLVYLPQSVLQGENLGYKRMGLSTSLVFVNGALLATAVTLGKGIVGMAVATVAVTVLSGAVYLHIARTRVAWFGIARPTLAGVRSFAGLSWWFLLWNLVMRMMQASDVVVVGIAGSSSLVTTYALTRYVPHAITLAAALMIFAIMPGLGGLIGAGDLARAARIRDETMSLIWLMATIAGATVLLWEESFLRLWVGARYYPGTIATFAIVLMVLQFALIRTDSNIIDLTLSLRRKVLLGGLSAALSVSLGWFFLGTLDMGLVGLVLGFVAGRAVLSVGYPLMVGRLLGISPRRQLVGVVRPALATIGLFTCCSALTGVAHARSWVALVLSSAVTVAGIGILACFAGLPVGSRRRVWARVRKVARLT